MAEIIKVNGKRETIQDLSLENCQKIVGGYIQHVYLKDGKVLIVNEEGKLDNLPVNQDASKLYDNPLDIIVGDVILADISEVI